MTLPTKSRFQLPVAEDDLWQMVVVQLLRQRDVTEAAAELHLRVLEKLAFEQQFHARPITRSRFIEAATRLADELKLGAPGDKARRWLADLESWELLVVNTDSGEPTYDFPIPGMGEFFAARYLAARWACADKRLWWKPLRWLALSCRAQFPPFRALLRRTEHEQTLLLMVGLVNNAVREGALVQISMRNADRCLKVLSRCRYAHPTFVHRIGRRFVPRFFFRVLHGSYFWWFTLTAILSAGMCQWLLAELSPFVVWTMWAVGTLNYGIALLFDANLRNKSVAPFPELPKAGLSALGRPRDLRNRDAALKYLLALSGAKKPLYYRCILALPDMPMPRSLRQYVDGRVDDWADFYYDCSSHAGRAIEHMSGTPRHHTNTNGTCVVQRVRRGLHGA